MCAPPLAPFSFYSSFLKTHLIGSDAMKNSLRYPLVQYRHHQVARLQIDFSLQASCLFVCTAAGAAAER